MRRFFAITICAAIASGVSARAQEQGDQRAGLATARMICAECHAVERDAAPTAAPRPGQAPEFVAIAARRGLTALAVRVALRTPHQTMPNLMLNDRQIDDLAAYILSLRR